MELVLSTDSNYEEDQVRQCTVIFQCNWSITTGGIFNIEKMQYSKE